MRCGSPGLWVVQTAVESRWLAHDRGANEGAKESVVVPAPKHLGPRREVAREQAQGLFYVVKLGTADLAVATH